MNISTLAEAAVLTECEPDIATACLQSGDSEVDDKVDAVRELIVTNVLYEVFRERNEAILTLNDERNRVAQLANTLLWDTATVEKMTDAFFKNHPQLLQYRPTDDQIENSIQERLPRILHVLKNGKPRKVNLTELEEYTAEMDFERFLSRQRKKAS